VSDDNMLVSLRTQDRFKTMKEIEREYIEFLISLGKSKQQIADCLGVCNKTLYRKLHIHGLMFDGYPRRKAA
jgi:DNA-binding NtrC family response regulator